MPASASSIASASKLFNSVQQPTRHDDNNPSRRHARSSPPRVAIVCFLAHGRSDPVFVRWSCLWRDAKDPRDDEPPTPPNESEVSARAPTPRPARTLPRGATRAPACARRARAEPARHDATRTSVNHVSQCGSSRSRAASGPSVLSSSLKVHWSTGKPSEEALGKTSGPKPSTMSEGLMYRSSTSQPPRLTPRTTSAPAATASRVAAASSAAEATVRRVVACAPGIVGGAGREARARKVGDPQVKLSSWHWFQLKHDDERNVTAWYTSRCTDVVFASST